MKSAWEDTATLIGVEGEVLERLHVTHSVIHVITISSNCISIIEVIIEVFKFPLLKYLNFSSVKRVSYPSIM